MASSLPSDRISLLLMYGYMHRMDTLLGQIIPDQIINICLAFRGRFDSIGGICFGRTLIRTVYYVDTVSTKLQELARGWVFGRLAINSVSKKVHCWKLQVIQWIEPVDFSIGLTDEDNCYQGTALHEHYFQAELDFEDGFENPRLGFQLLNGNGHRMMYIEQYTELKLTFDGRMKSLCCFVDDKLCGRQWIECGKDIDYKLNLFVDGEGLRMKLIDYSETR